MQFETRLQFRCSAVTLRLALAASLAVCAAALVAAIAPAGAAAPIVTYSGSLAAFPATGSMALALMRQSAADAEPSTGFARRDEDSPALAAHDADRTVDDADDTDDDDDPSGTVNEISIPAASSRRSARSPSPTRLASPLIHLVATPVRC